MIFKECWRIYQGFLQIIFTGKKSGSKILHVTLQCLTICYESHFPYIETSQLMWKTNQLTGFYMREMEGTLKII